MFIQILYNEGSQISLVNKYCTPLIVESRKSDQPIKIGSVIGETSEIRQINKLYLREDCQIEGVLVLWLALKPTVVKRPLCMSM